MKKRCSWPQSGVLLLTAILSSNSFAGLGGGAGTGVGNGGTVVELPDGSVVMADPFVQDNTDPYQSFSNIDTNVQNEFKFLDRLLVRYGAIADQSLIPDDDFGKGVSPTEQDALNAAKKQQEAYSRTGQSNFFVTLVQNPQVKYHFIPGPPSVSGVDLPTNCQQSEEDIQLPVNVSGAITELAACTIKWDTYIRQDLYDQMDYRNKVMLLLHERLHSLDYTQHFNIIRITNGAFLALDLYRQQSLVLQQKPNAQFSDFTPLTPAQVTTLQQMVGSIADMSYLLDDTAPNEDGIHWTVSPNGGGIYFLNPDLDPGAVVNENASITPTSFIGAGSVLGKLGSIGNDAIMINSSCFTSACALAGGSSMIESVASAENEDAQKFSLNLDSTAQMINSQITVNSPDSSTVVHLAASASISNSNVHGVSGLDVGLGASLSASLLNFNPQDAVTTNIVLGAGSDTEGVNGNIFTHSSPNSSLLTISVPANQKLQLQMAVADQCQPGARLSLSNDLALNSLASITGLCTPFLSPGPSH